MIIFLFHIYKLGIFRNIISSTNINSSKLKGKLLSDNTYAESIKITILRNNNFYCKYNKDIDFISRIKMHDITALQLIYDDNEKEMIYCCWDGTSEINNLQYEEINNDYIIISINC